MLEMFKGIAARVFRKPYTRRHPFEVREPFPGARGSLDMDPDVCVYCGLCQKRCPTSAITVARKPNSWQFNPHRCVLCGHCVDVCPVKCIVMKPQYRPPSA